MVDCAIRSAEDGLIASLASKYCARAVFHRRELHKIPEAGLELPDTVAYVKGALSAAGLSA